MPASATWDCIRTETATGNATGVLMSNIPQTYTDLVIVQYLRSQRSATTEQFWQRFNGDDTSSNYSYTNFQGDGSSITGSRFTNQSVTNRILIPAASSTANIFGMSIVHVMNYTSTTQFKTVLAQWSCDLNGSGTTGLSMGLWRQTAAITTINVATENGSNLTAGSMVSLYGIKAA